MADSFEKFGRFLEFFSTLFSRPGLLADAACRQSYKVYVPDYYREIFGAGAQLASQRHLRWYRRLAPLFTLPQGSRILDYGGGYGMDAIFLASLGYQVIFYELTPHHIAIARWFADKFEADHGKLAIQFCLVGKDPTPSELDAVFANEVAHHIEPAQRVFDDAASMLRKNGHLFLLEPNYWSPASQAFFLRARGLRTTEWHVDEATGEKFLWGNEHIRPVRTWNRFAQRAGLHLREVRYVSSGYHGARSEPELGGAHGVETWPVARTFLASHVSLHYEKT